MLLSTRILCYGLFLTIVVLDPAKGQSSAGDTLSVSLDANFQNATLQEVFEAVDSLTGFHFTYHQGDYLNRRVSLNRERIKIHELLAIIAQCSGLDFRQRGENISVRVAERGAKNRTASVTISGQVSSLDTREALAGVNVLIKNSTVGTITDAAGRYQLAVADTSNATLAFSFVGYRSQEAPLGRGLTVDVKLAPRVKDLSEVVVVGYGTQVKRALTGAISGVASETIAQNVNADPVTSLQGNTAGVQLTQASGQPGGAIRVRVRGSASLLSSGNPLVVVDGVPIIASSFGASTSDGISSLSEFNPNDIESMEVLKDGAAAAIYGSRAANGVILITTKQGEAGQHSLTLDYQQGLSAPTNRVDLLNGPDLRAVNQRAWTNTVLAGTEERQFFPIPRNVDGVNGYRAEVAAATDVDWLDYVLRRGAFRNVNVSASTGSEKTTLFASLGYRDEEGIEIGRTFTRASGRVKVNYQASDHLQTGVNVSLSYVQRDNPGHYFGTAQAEALPIFPVYRPDDPSVLFNGFNAFDNGVGTNPIFYRNNHVDRTQTYRAFSAMFVDWQPAPGWSLRSEWGIDYQHNANDVAYSSQLFPPNNNSSQAGSLGKSTTRRFFTVAWNTNNTLTYRKEWEQGHELTALIGSSWLNQENQGRTIVRKKLAHPDGPSEQELDSQSLFRFVSFFSRLNYDYQSKYFAQLSARRDGSSRFGPGRRFGTFVGGAVGWVFTEEDFWAPSVRWVDFGKLRASYGTVGNAELPSDFLWISLADVNDSEISYGGFKGVAYGRIGNRDLSWETTRQVNAGLDLSLFRRRLDLTIDLYHKRSDDLLLGSRLANNTGYLERDYAVNVGALKNQGVELSVGTTNLHRGHFQWTSRLNVSHNRSRVLRLAPPVNSQDTHPATFTTGDVKLVEGGHFGSYFLPIWAGVDPTTGHELIYEVDQGHLQETGIARLTGEVLDAEALGGDITRHRMRLDDKTAVPDIFGGVSNSFTYRAWSLDVLLYFQHGNYLLDRGEMVQSYPGEQRSLRAKLKEGLTVRPGRFSSEVPLVYNSSLSSTPTTRFLHDASFVRLRNVRVSYDVPVEKIPGVAGLQLYAVGQNLLTLTRFPGWDPEVFNGGGNQQQSNAGPGSIEFTLPQVKTFLLGVTLRF